MMPLVSDMQPSILPLKAGSIAAHDLSREHEPIANVGDVDKCEGPGLPRGPKESFDAVAGDRSRRPLGFWLSFSIS